MQVSVIEAESFSTIQTHKTKDSLCTRSRSFSTGLLSNEDCLHCFLYHSNVLIP
jgi:hypothetical protein